MGQLLGYDTSQNPNTVARKIDKWVLSALLTVDQAQRKYPDGPFLTEKELEDLFKTFTQDPTPISEDVFNVPRLLGQGRCPNAPKLTADSQKIQTELLRRFPLIVKVLKIAPKNLLVAGGSVCQAMSYGDDNSYENRTWGDIDIFFYGDLSEQDASLILKNLIELLQTESRGQLSRNGYTISYLTGDNSVYQFILRIFKTPFQVLSSFDHSPCAVGYGLDLGPIALQAAAFSIATKTLVVDPTKMNPTSSTRRIWKYFQRGFTLIIPSMKKNWTGTPQASFCLGGGGATLSISYGYTQDQTKAPPMHLWPGGVAGVRPQEDQDDYGSTGYELGILGLYNYRRIRTGARSWKDLSWTAPNYDDLIKNPTFCTGQPVDQWFSTSNLERIEGIVNWDDLNEYSHWDIADRLDEEHVAALWKARREKSVDDARAVLQGMQDLYARVIEDVTKQVPDHLTWQVVGDEWPVPWTGLIAPQDFYPKEDCVLMYHSTKELLKLDPDTAFHFCLLKARDPIWKKLPKEVFHHIMNEIVLVYNQNIIDFFFYGLPAEGDVVLDV